MLVNTHVYSLAFLSFFLIPMSLFLGGENVRSGRGAHETSVEVVAGLFGPIQPAETVVVMDEEGYGHGAIPSSRPLA